MLDFITPALNGPYYLYRASYILEPNIKIRDAIWILHHNPLNASHAQVPFSNLNLISLFNIDDFRLKVAQFRTILRPDGSNITNNCQKLQENIPNVVHFVIPVGKIITKYKPPKSKKSL